MGHKARRLLVAAFLVLGAGAAGAQTTPTPMSTRTAAVTSSPAALATTTPTIDHIVSITHTVEPGSASVSAFTVPAGERLIVTDVVITNPGTTPICGAAISPGGAVARTSATTGAAGTTLTTTTTANTTTITARGATTTTTPGGTMTTTTPGGSTVTTPGPPAATASAATTESGTGALCVPAQTSLALSLTTGLEFAGGQSVMLANQPLPSGPMTTGGTSLTTAAAPATTSTPLLFLVRGFLAPSGL
jgi:hypothetical protein